MELALRHMRTGQRCLVRCATRFAYGPDGCPAKQVGDTALPPNADVELMVELVDILSTTVTAKMTPEEKLVEYHRKKMVGNDHYAGTAWRKALRAYVSVLNATSKVDFPADSPTFEEARQLQVDCGNNVAIVCMRLGELEKARDAAVGVLVLDPLNVKALFRAGRISLLQGNFTEAKLALQKALSVSPESKEIQAELSRLSARVRDYRVSKRAMQETMGRSLFADQREEEPDPSRGNKSRAVAEPLERFDRPDDYDGIPAEYPKEATKRSPAFDRCRMVLMYSLVPFAAWGITYALLR